MYAGTWGVRVWVLFRVPFFNETVCTIDSDNTIHPFLHHFYGQVIRKVVYGRDTSISALLSLTKLQHA